MWEAIFMLLILKIPIVYLALVVWWAIRAEPKPYEPALTTAPLDPDPSHPGWRWSRRLPRGPRRGPHGSRARRPALARRAEANR